ncbi:hypothetical protein GQ43DRAFT_393736 [Delitschia confertaspora ATCC 74209]|uniref:Poly(A) RNA polymerase mitochondrial-like central palm domain-containing protein n=1 Tax=Delitschia confertaspora ATCC 74209 TaxID=1513339 RepID=A0A9P4MT38_9PLEO|nr:hypothetical protein GQ43DRAFT_393736 [Delitschia confertaspora ATCC 74209]
MHTSQSRLVCRAPNRFKPSVALWQHFVVPNKALCQRRRYSSVVSNQPLSSSPFDHRTETHSNVLSECSIDASLAGVRKRDALDTSVRQGNTIFRKIRLDTIHPQPQRLRRRARPEVVPGIATCPGFGTETAGHPIEDIKLARKGEYEGKFIKNLPSTAIDREEEQPWVIPGGGSKLSGLERLSAEILRFYDYARPTKAERALRQASIKRIQGITEQILPGTTLEVFGSERTGLSLYTSDIDLRLPPKSGTSETTIQAADGSGDLLTAGEPPSKTEKSKMDDAMRQLKIQLKKSPMLFAKPQFARFPLISVFDYVSRLETQIVLSHDTSHSRELMEGYIQEFPYLPQIYTLLKVMLDVRNLSNVYLGGIGSYPLFMMAVAALKHRPHVAKNNLAEQFLAVLDFWAKLDTYKHGVSIEPPELFEKGSGGSGVRAQPPKAGFEFLLSLEDPANPSNDLGGQGACIKHVQATFRQLEHQLAVDMKWNNRPSLLTPLVPHHHTINRVPRETQERIGRWLLEHPDRSYESYVEEHKGKKLQNVRYLKLGAKKGAA